MAEDRLDPVDIAQLRLNQPAPNASGLIGSAGDDDLSDSADASDTPDLSTSDIPPEVNDSLSSMAAKYGDDSPIRKGYEAAIARLKSQRAGMSNKEKIAALLIGFGKPTPGGIGNQLSNAAQMLLAQSAVSNKRDDAREALIAKYMADEPVKMSSAQTAMARANKPAPLVNDGQQRTRLGYARNLFPGLSDEQLVAQNKLYDPQVERLLIRLYAAHASAGAGEDIADDAIAAPPEAPVIKTPEEGAQHPNAPMVMTPRGLMHNPYYKGA